MTIRFDKCKDAMIGVLIYGESGQIVNAIVAPNERLTQPSIGNFYIDGMPVPSDGPRAGFYYQIFPLVEGLYPKSPRLVEWMLGGELIFVASGISKQQLIDAVYNRPNAFMQFLTALNDGAWPNIMRFGTCTHCAKELANTECGFCYFGHTKARPVVVGHERT